MKKNYDKGKKGKKKEKKYSQKDKEINKVEKITYRRGTKKICSAGGGARGKTWKDEIGSPIQ